MSETYIQRAITGEAASWKPQREVYNNVHRAGSVFIDDLAAACERPGGCDNGSNSDVDGRKFKVVVECELDGRPCYLQTLEYGEVAVGFDDALRRVEYGETY